MSVLTKIEVQEYLCVCVCVRDELRERERDREIFFDFYQPLYLRILNFTNLQYYVINK